MLPLQPHAVRRSEEVTLKSPSAGMHMKLSFLRHHHVAHEPRKATAEQGSFEGR